jgi:hypothetical protein
VALRRTHSGRGVVAAASLLFALAVPLVFAVAPAFGQNAKVQAEAKKLQSDAMDVDFLGLEFKKAKTKLQDALKKCGPSNCDKPTLATIHRDLGIVLINMKDPANGDAEFYEAFTADPNVTIAKDYLDNTDVKKSWEGAKKGASVPTTTAPTPTPTPTTTSTTPPTTGPDGNIKINATVAPTHVQLPIVVSAPDGADAVKVFYKTAAMEKYTMVEAKKQGGKYLVLLGCEHTQFAGEIKVYVRVYDAEKNEVDHLGSLKNPAVIKLVEKLPNDVEAPMLPGDKEPEKCVEKNDCPPGLPCSGKKSEGSGCETDDDCDTDLSCVLNDNGTKWCHDTGGKTKPTTGKAPKFFIGLHLDGDLLFLGKASGICNDGTWACTKDGKEVKGTVDDPNTISAFAPGDGSTDGGPAIGTFRVLASFDYFVTGNFALGARVGYAVRGNNSTKAKFVPYHAEGRLHFFPVAIDDKVSGIRGYISVAGGLGEFDAAVPNVTVITTPDSPNGQPCPGGTCVSGISAYRLAGLGFAAVGGGAWLFVTSKTALNFGARLIFPIPTFSLGLSAEFGVVTGF